MFPRATVAVTASTDLVVEGAIDLEQTLVAIREHAGLRGTYLVLFGSKDGGEIIRHDVLFELKQHQKTVAELCCSSKTTIAVVARGCKFELELQLFLQKKCLGKNWRSGSADKPG